MIIDMNYFSKVLKKIIITAITILGVYIGIKLAIFYIPFLIAFIISLILEPAIKFLMKKCKFTRKYSAIILLLIIILSIIGILIFIWTTLIEESSNFLENINYYVQFSNNRIQELKLTITRWNIPQNIINILENSITDLINTIGTELGNGLKKGVNLISSVPTIAIYLGITILSLYFLTTDKVYMLDQLEHHLPESWVKKIYSHTKEITGKLGNYLKAQMTLVFISFVITLIGLYTLYFIGFDIKYPLLYSLGIGFVDALPIFGSGTIMIPWAIYSASIGNLKLGIYILILWIIMTVLRQLLEPKIVGNKIGIHPIFTLIAMYSGFKIIGISGLFIGPIILIILKSIFSTMLDNGFVKTIFSREI